MILENKMRSNATIQHRHDIDTLVVRWHCESSTDELKAVYERLLTTAAIHRTCKWLLDLRQRNDSNPVLALWLRDVFLPQVLPSICSSVRIAYLVSPLKMVELNKYDGLTILNGAVVNSLGVNTCITKAFINESDVYDWLNQIN